jgi:hypothetical protein
MSNENENFMTRMRRALKGLSPADLAARRDAARARIAEAEAEYSTIALEVELGAPGAAVRLERAREAVENAKTKLQDLDAAQTAVEAQERERGRKKAAALAEREDREARAALDALAATAVEGEAVIRAFVEWWAKFVKAWHSVQAQSVKNPRFRHNVAHLSFAEFVRRELARVASSDPMPPGANAGAALLDDRRTWKPLGQEIGELAATALPAKST